jgi:hypothetical protein
MARAGRVEDGWKESGMRIAACARHGLAALGPIIGLPATLHAQELISEFAQNVATHVLIHEVGHAVFREFGLPILANEETMADSFATAMITQLMTDEAVAIVTDRARCWMVEDAEARAAGLDLLAEMRGEHELDIRRAYQAMCLLYGADPAEWSAATVWVGFSEEELADCSDTAPDQIEGWDAVLAPHGLPPGERSANVEVIYNEGPLTDSFVASGTMDRVADMARRLDWPEPITLRFDHCDDGARWSRDDRTVLLCDGYLARFIAQGDRIARKR